VSDELLAQLSRASGVDMRELPDGIMVGATSITMPDWDNLDFRHAFPSRAHGDQREKLLYFAIQDAGDQAPTLTDGYFSKALEGALPVSDDRAARVVAQAMREQYWVNPSRRPFLLPYHSALPLSFALSLGDDVDQRARYRMFSGVLIPFLCWTGERPDSALMVDLLAVFNGEEGFTLLDDLLLQAVRQVAGEPGVATAEKLEQRMPADVRAALSAGAFCQPALDRFQRDLRTVLNMRLPRRDRIEALNQLLGLHLAILYYRVATVLGEELDQVVAADAGLPPGSGGCDCKAGLAGCSLAGKIRFRVGTRGYRPVSMRDGCVQSHREIDSKRLLALPANIIMANVLQHIWRGLDPAASVTPQPRILAAKLRQEPEFARIFAAAARAFAVLYRRERKLPELERPGDIQNGVHALREAILMTRRANLKYTSRDVVNQLALDTTGVGGSLLRRHGTRATFFELDEPFLFLIAKLICEDREMPIDEFERGLAEYGLAPQDAAEQSRLVDALEGMGMLVRYSDSGDSAYVRHIV